MNIFTTVAKQITDNIKEQREKVAQKKAINAIGNSNPLSFLANNKRPIEKVENYRELVDKAANSFGHLPAFHLEGENGNFSRPVSFIQFKEQVYGLGTAMASQGMLDGFVGILSENRYEWCLSYLTIGAGGTVIVPLDKELGVEDLHQQIIDGGITTLFYSKSMAKKVAEIVAAKDTQLKHLINMDLEENTEDEYSMKVLVSQGIDMYIHGNETYESRSIHPEKLGILVFKKHSFHLSIH